MNGTRPRMTGTHDLYQSIVARHVKKSLFHCLVQKSSWEFVDAALFLYFKLRVYWNPKKTKKKLVLASPTSYNGLIIICIVEQTAVLRAIDILSDSSSRVGRKCWYSKILQGVLKVVPVRSIKKIVTSKTISRQFQGSQSLLISEVR
jgi:hypothetical protein